LVPKSSTLHDILNSRYRAIRTLLQKRCVFGAQHKLVE